MKDAFFTITSETEGIVKDRGSKFIAIAFPAKSENIFQLKLAEIKKKHAGASHFCYAYRIGIPSAITRANDDGEPNGTAGKPILNQITSKNLHNTALVVVRYFGGTLLGTGGLIKAYKNAAEEALKNAIVVNEFVVSTYRVTFEFAALNDILKIVKDNNGLLKHKLISNECLINVEVRDSQKNKFEVEIQKIKLKNYTCSLHEEKK